MRRYPSANQLRASPCDNIRKLFTVLLRIRLHSVAFQTFFWVEHLSQFVKMACTTIASPLYSAADTVPCSPNHRLTTTNLEAY